MTPKKKVTVVKSKPRKTAAVAKKGAVKKAAPRRIRTSGEKAIDPLHLNAGVRTSQTNI